MRSESLHCYVERRASSITHCARRILSSQKGGSSLSVSARNRSDTRFSNKRIGKWPSLTRIAGIFIAVIIAILSMTAAEQQSAPLSNSGGGVRLAAAVGVVTPICTSAAVFTQGAYVIGQPAAAYTMDGCTIEALVNITFEPSLVLSPSAGGGPTLAITSSGVTAGAGNGLCIGGFAPTSLAAAADAPPVNIIVHNVVFQRDTVLHVLGGPLQEEQLPPRSTISITGCTFEGTTQANTRSVLAAGSGLLIVPLAVGTYNTPLTMNAATTLIIQSNRITINVPNASTYTVMAIAVIGSNMTLMPGASVLVANNSITSTIKGGAHIRYIGAIADLSMDIQHGASLLIADNMMRCTSNGSTGTVLGVALLAQGGTFTMTGATAGHLRNTITLQTVVTLRYTMVTRIAAVTAYLRDGALLLVEGNTLTASYVRVVDILVVYNFFENLYLFNSSIFQLASNSLYVEEAVSGVCCIEITTDYNFELADNSAVVAKNNSIVIGPGVSKSADMFVFEIRSYYRQPLVSNGSYVNILDNFANVNYTGTIYPIYQLFRRLENASYLIIERNTFHVHKANTIVTMVSGSPTIFTNRSSCIIRDNRLYATTHTSNANGVLLQGTTFDVTKDSRLIVTGNHVLMAVGGTVGPRAASCTIIGIDLRATSMITVDGNSSMTFDDNNVTVLSPVTALAAVMGMRITGTTLRIGRGCAVTFKGNHVAMDVSRVEAKPYIYGVSIEPVANYTGDDSQLAVDGNTFDLKSSAMYCAPVAVSVVGALASTTLSSATRLSVDGNWVVAAGADPSTLTAASLTAATAVTFGGADVRQCPTIIVNRTEELALATFSRNYVSAQSPGGAPCIAVGELKPRRAEFSDNNLRWDVHQSSPFTTSSSAMLVVFRTTHYGPARAYVLERNVISTVTYNAAIVANPPATQLMANPVNASIAAGGGRSNAVVCMNKLYGTVDNYHWARLLGANHGAYMTIAACDQNRTVTPTLAESRSLSAMPSPPSASRSLSLRRLVTGSRTDPHYAETVTTAGTSTISMGVSSTSTLVPTPPADALLTPTGTSSVSLALTPTVGDLPATAPPLARADDTESAAAAVGGSVVALGVVSPMGAMQQGVALALVRMAGCGEDGPLDGTPLDMLVHPLYFGIGDGPTRYGRGAVLSNTIVIPLAWSLTCYYVAPLVLVHLMGMPSMLDARDFLGWPGNLAVPMALFAEGSAMATMALIIGGEKGEGDDASYDAGNAVLGAIGMLVLVGFLCTWALYLYHLMKRPNLQLVRVPDPSFIVKKLVHSRWEWIMANNHSVFTFRATGEASRKMLAGLVGDRDAEEESEDGREMRDVPLITNNNDDDEGIKTAVAAEDDDDPMDLDTRGSGLPIPRYLQRRILLVGSSWWLWSAICAYALSVAVGVSEAIPTETVTECRIRWVFACVCALAQAFVVLTTTIPLELLLFGLSGLLVGVLSVIVTLGLFGAIDTTDGLEDAMNTVGTLSSVVGILLMVVGIVETVLKLMQWRVGRTVRKARIVAAEEAKKKKQEEEHPQQQQASVALPSLEECALLPTDILPEIKPSEKKHDEPKPKVIAPDNDGTPRRDDAANDALTAAPSSVGSAAPPSRGEHGGALRLGSSSASYTSAATPSHYLWILEEADRAADAEDERRRLQKESSRMF